jgi:putative peptide zinc metalloprotease protein
VAKTLFSSSWYRVADLKPRLRDQAEIHRQRFRKQTWYILQDHQSGRFHRVSPAAHLLICLMNGRRTMREIWELAGERLGEDQPTQDETIKLLSQLHSSDLVHGDIPPDMGELEHRSARQQRQNIMQRVKNPMSLRFPLLDPDGFLDATLGLVRPIFTPLGFLVWVALTITAIVLAVVHWAELTENLGDRVLVAQNIALMAVVYPVVKAIHELGHAYAVKIWGGEVHEIGLMILVFMPVPYVDASASSAFRDKWRRAVVGGAGIMVEMLLASLALILWLNVEPGLVRALAFNVMLIAGVSTVLFNGNPLLRFDGYYVLSDIVEIPNLGTRANRYLFYLIQRYLFGIEDLDCPATARGERAWFVCYGIAAFFYRITIFVGISLFVGTKLLGVGVLLAIFAAINTFIMPLVKGVKFVASDSRLKDRRRRAVGVCAAVSAVILIAVLVVPVPYATIAQGVVWAPERAALRASAEGLVTEVLSLPNSRVTAGKALIRAEDPELGGRIAVLEAQLRELRLRLDSIKLVDLIQAEMLRDQIVNAEAARDLLRERHKGLTLRANWDGRFIVPRAADLPGRYVNQGELLGYLVEDGDTVVRVVVPQADIDMVRHRTRKVEVRLSWSLKEILPATVKREVPSAVDDLPSMALSTQGGGDVAVDSSNPEAPRALERIFQFDLGLKHKIPENFIGGRVYVRFDHGNEAVASRMFRSLRRLFLSHFRV